MEINTSFETYLELNEDTDVNVLVQAIGEVRYDNFDHEFGNEEYNTIENVEVIRVINLDSNEVIDLSTLGKKQLTHLRMLAEVELEDRINDFQYEDMYD